MRTAPPASSPFDAGLLTLRLGLGLCQALLLVYPPAQEAWLQGMGPGRFWPLGLASIGVALIAAGWWTRFAAPLLVVIWMSALVGEIQSGARLGSFPVRSVLFAVLFASLAVMGPGAWSLDHLLRRGPTPRPSLR
jgi:uncharacterized membrane protein YphA (DoxX/SURF4 family)